MQCFEAFQVWHWKIHGGIFEAPGASLLSSWCAVGGKGLEPNPTQTFDATY